MLVQDYRDPQKWGDPAFVAFVVAVCCLASCTSTTHEFVQAQMTGCRLGPCGSTFSIACAHFQEEIVLPYTLFRPRWLRASMQSGGESYRKPSHYLRVCHTLTRCRATQIHGRIRHFRCLRASLTS